jgi:hypothetical protein
VILYTSGTLGIPEPEPELAGSVLLELLSGNNSYYSNFSKPELSDPNFATRTLWVTRTPRLNSTHELL